MEVQIPQPRPSLCFGMDPNTYPAENQEETIFGRCSKIIVSDKTKSSVPWIHNRRFGKRRRWWGFEACCSGGGGGGNIFPSLPRTKKRGEKHQPLDTDRFPTWQNIMRPLGSIDPCRGMQKAPPLSQTHYLKRGVESSRTSEHVMQMKRSIAVVDFAAQLEGGARQEWIDWVLARKPAHRLLQANLDYEKKKKEETRVCRNLLTIKKILVRHSYVAMLFHIVISGRKQQFFLLLKKNIQPPNGRPENIDNFNFAPNFGVILTAYFSPTDYFNPRPYFNILAAVICG